MGVERHTGQLREEFQTREQAEAYRATRALTEPGVSWVLFPVENGRWAVARDESGQAESGSTAAGDSS
jgi:hypothetical protein